MGAEDETTGNVVSHRGSWDVCSAEGFCMGCRRACGQRFGHGLG
jgi:hypothetical protein